MALPNYPAALDQPKIWLDEEPTEAFGKFEEVLSEAAGRGVLSDLPASLEESGATLDKPEAFVNYQERAQVISERLWLLGYLKLDRKEDARNLFLDSLEGFLAAVGKFQTEAGLVQDGWVGKKTWTLLSNLVNFEPLPKEAGNEALDHEPWNKPLGAGLDNRAVMRAAALRLHALGIAKIPPGKGTPYRRPERRAVKDFHRLLWSLGLVNKLYGDRLTKMTLPLLMQHDGILERVAVADRDGDDQFNFNRPSEWAEEAFKDKVQLFLTRLVQIELWLLGSEVDLEEWRRYPVRGIRQRPVFDPTEDQNDAAGEFFDPGRLLESRLREYYQVFRGLDKNEARRQAEEIKPSLFKSFLNPSNEQISGSSAELEESATYEKILSNIDSSSEAESLLDTGRSLGLRIWDGLKRVWRWLKRRIVKVIKFGKNLARAFYRYASKGFSVVKRAIRAVVSSIQRYVSGEFDFGGVSIRLSKDFDTDLLVPNGLQPAFIDEAGTRLQLFASRFVLACRILGLIFEAFVLSAMNRWARLAVTLTSKLKELIHLYRSMVALERKLPADLH